MPRSRIWEMNMPVPVNGSRTFTERSSKDLPNSLFSTHRTESSIKLTISTGVCTMPCLVAAFLSAPRKNESYMARRKSCLASGSVNRSMSACMPR